MKWKRNLLLLFMLLALSLTACQEEKPPKNGGGSLADGGGSAASDPDWPVRVGDTDIPASPQRVVSLSPGATEMLFAMGLGSRVVGVSDYCDYPVAEVEKRHRCGSVLSPDTRQIQAQGADLVVASAKLTERDLIWFQQQEIPVLVLERAESLDQLRQNYLDLALALMGATSGKNHGEGYWEELMGMLREGRMPAEGTPMKAILLRQMGYGMATGDTFEGALLEELGFVNDAAAYTGWLYDRANVAALEPDVIFADVSIPVDQVKQSVIYRPVAAVKNNKVMNVDFAVFERQSPRMFEALREMGKFAAA
ncbi:MAG: ABC transporter substrate-binding protein [Angelakisella sp.]|jgi:iron complex transport system substrate-binding protein|nr:ABC transporter substrate-binding protein [Angelakisella sp.]